MSALTFTPNTQNAPDSAVVMPSASTPPPILLHVGAHPVGVREFLGGGQQCRGLQRIGERGDQERCDQHRVERPGEITHSRQLHRRQAGELRQFAMRHQPRRQGAA